MGPGGVGDESNELVEQECRVAVLGEPAVGKTALVNRFVRGKIILESDEERVAGSRFKTPTSSSSVSPSRTTPPSTPLLTTGCLSSRTCARTLQPCLLDASQICAHPQDFSDLCPPSTGSPYLGKPAPPSTLRPPPSPTTPAAPTLLLRWPVLPLLATSQGLHLRRDLSPEGEQGGERQASQGVREVARA